MREVKYYVAWDDSEFETKEECMKYENDAINKMLIFKSLYTFFDKDKNILLCPETKNIEDLLNWADCSAEECDYIYRSGQLPEDVNNFIRSEIGYCICNWDFHDELGLFQWDDEEAEWVRVGE